MLIYNHIQGGETPMELPKTLQVYKDGRCLTCTLTVLAVRGGKQVLYVAEDGAVLKREPLFRFTERLKRRKGEVGYAIKI
jgi:hypothetical protein